MQMETNKYSFQFAEGVVLLRPQVRRDTLHVPELPCPETTSRRGRAHSLPGRSDFRLRLAGFA